MLLPDKVDVNYPHLEQIVRIKLYKELLGQEVFETVYAITSLKPEQASPEKLLELESGFRRIECLYHGGKDDSFFQDDEIVNRNQTHRQNLVLIFSNQPIELASNH